MRAYLLHVDVERTIMVHQWKGGEGEDVKIVARGAIMLACFHYISLI